MTLQTLVKEAAKLSRAERALLLDELIRLQGPEESDVDLTPAQQDDLDRRIDEFRAGKATLVSGDDAFAQLRKRG